MEYELINPSDPYTFVAESYEAASLAVHLLGSMYGAKAKDESHTVPVAMFLSNDWFAKEFGHSAEEGFLENREKIAGALESMMYGCFEDRKRYEAALEAIDDPKKKEIFIQKWQDGISSLNNIGEYAHSLAKKIMDGKAEIRCKYMEGGFL